MKKEITIGCSSFNNRLWKGVFYPENLPTSKWFDYYCEHFNTYEINSTFYKFPTVRIMQNWYKKVPDGFWFAVKAHKDFTHIKKLKDCAEALADFYTVCEEGLKEKLGYVLFQFPPSYSYEPERLENIINTLDKKFSNAVEFRHESWWIPEVREKLLMHNITCCSVNYPKLPTTIFTVAPLLYIRLHGNPQLFYSAYTTEEMTDLATIIRKATTKKIVIYLNNTASTAGILNALELKKLLA